jgi:SEFIR domain.
MPNGPKAFISCSRSSTEHQKWALSLATQLQENNVDVISDKWDLREGERRYRFHGADRSATRVLRWLVQSVIRPTPSQRTQIVRHVAKFPDHLRVDCH